MLRLGTLSRSYRYFKLEPLFTFRSGVASHCLFEKSFIPIQSQLCSADPDRFRQVTREGSEMSRLGKVLSVPGLFADWGVSDTLSRIMWGLAMSAFSGGYRKVAVPTLGELCEAADDYSSDPAAVLARVSGAGASEIDALRREFESVGQGIGRRYEQHPDLPYPREWAVEDGSAFLLYATVRLQRPAVVLELGVANGHSSLLIIAALMKNGSGFLHSIDIGDDVGKLLNSAERQFWKLHVLPLPVRKRQFEAILDELPPIDLILQDSDHRYRWTHFELEKVLPKMAPGGLCLCDDTERSYAIPDIAKTSGLDLSLLLDVRKVFGVLAREPQIDSRGPSSNWRASTDSLVQKIR
jgi:predicted O-methyltransferase YrrM